ncbi:hypothetical protein E4Z66_15190 [Aliishimia ponticola]|uniref:TonB-dependent receptor n=1 Tax=Aliishimia ponticola TaxID=2499833 RepID=A0A4S4N9U5_9RHOB|nr:hypothetical protein [Aliishimia ponticola]THH35167.1 hypothetical protein E4Z66_15190 [Aliishimia ponticola]
MNRYAAITAVLLSTTALPVLAQSGSGFSISLNGDQVSGDPVLRRKVEKADEQLQKADVRVQYDGLVTTPRLDLQITGSDAGYAPGQTVTLQSEMNYPGFVTRGEVLLIERRVRGGPRVLSRHDVPPNGAVSITVPEGENIVAVHRVYDARGRYDETAPLTISTGDERGLEDGVEDGSSALVRRGIPVFGGAVTVSGSSVAPGASVQTLGETVRPDPSGRFVIQRILPPGDHAVSVRTVGAGPTVDIVRDIEVPRSELFYTAHIDLTHGYRDSDLDGSGTYTRGRIAGYFKGRYANGVEVTGQIDTGEGDLDEIFEGLDERDPRTTFLRIDPDDLYPTYGDDSTLFDDTPTSGKFYLRVQKDNNYVVWGDWRADLQGTNLLRNDRTLYGGRLHLESKDTTAHGDPNWRVEAYGAQPDALPQRDVFRGTGGSVYFLSRQDISIGTETMLVQVRDGTTGRVIETRTLVEGRDYTINYIQGIVTLRAPLQSSTGSNGIVITDPGGAADVNLVAQYEYTPDSGDVDAFAYGGRGEVWATEQLRFGATIQSEETGSGRQDAYGADLLYRMNEETFVHLEYARSDGPGFGYQVSTDGGLVFDPIAAAGGDGEAVRIEGRAALTDLGLGVDGTISGYWETRDAGFSSLDYTTTADETLWGLALDAQVTQRLTLGAYYDSYEQDGGRLDREGGVEADYIVNDRVSLAFGIENLERRGISGSGDGTRTDAAVRLTYSPRENLSWHVFAQNTLERSGTLESNDRYGAGVSVAWDNGWSVEGELSDGDLGEGGRILVRNDKGEDGNSYIGYDLDPTHEVIGMTMSETGRSRGRYIFGGERPVSDTVTVFGENSYDRFGRYQTLTSAYGVTYEPTDRLSYLTAFEVGQIRDRVNGDFDRYALSLGVQYHSEGWNGKARLEYRDEDGSRSGSTRDSQTWLLAGSGSYKIDENQRLVFSAQVSRTEGNSGIAPDSDYTDISIGYAYRPVNNERLNLLFRYRYLDDQYGQQLDNSDTLGPVQRSHVFSVDAEYDLNEQWSLGAKVGARLAESAVDSDSDYTRNDAVLGVLNARWHVVKNWDALFEVRALELYDAGTTEIGGLAAIYRHVGDHLKIGVGYNLTNFSDDLTDLTYDDRGAFINIVAKF